MITTVIFDLDGLLADTEKLHWRAYREALQAHGAILSETDYAEHWVRTGKGIGEWVAQHELALDPVAIRARKARRYLELLTTELRPMDGALELLGMLLGNKTMGLASSSYRDAVEGVLQGLDISRYFAAIVTGLDVTRVKPAPDIFLAAARLMGAKSAECLVLEDAEKGVLAAHRAGMRCIAVPNEQTRHHDFSTATCVCSSLHEITLELIDSFG